LANACWGRDNHSWDAIWDGANLPLMHFLEKDHQWTEKFHIWKMEWTKDFINLYLDDELLNKINVSEVTYKSGFNPFRQPHYILLNLALGSNGGDPSNAGFPICYEVDYVRVFQKKTN
jgi:beta-glucanase (GH16 family)